ncbi:MAG: hypothetical protein LLG03_03595 [Planctomycetaceae bacterium]|nr:hypothetical protein [Planctomycetaceae bacterium]
MVFTQRSWEGENTNDKTQIPNKPQKAKRKMKIVQRLLGRLRLGSWSVGKKLPSRKRRVPREKKSPQVFAQGLLCFL